MTSQWEGWFAGLPLMTNLLGSVCGFRGVPMASCALHDYSTTSRQQISMVFSRLMILCRRPDLGEPSWNGSSWLDASILKSDIQTMSPRGLSRGILCLKLISAIALKPERINSVVGVQAELLVHPMIIETRVVALGRSHNGMHSGLSWTINP
jgi:hypothetical protein